MEAWIRKTIVVLFSVWHMTAVGIYALSSDWHHSPIWRVKDRLLPAVRWYVLLTSQWQQWNLFSPDPLRRVSELIVEIKSEGAWTEAERFGTDIAGHRRAIILKTVRRLERDENAAARERLLELTCGRRGLSSGTPVRLRRRYAVIPKTLVPMSIPWWRRQRPSWHWDILAETTCSSSA